MKKYILLILFSLGLMHVDCQAAESIVDKENLNTGNRTISTKENDRISEIEIYFKNEKKKSSYLRDLSRNFDFLAFSAAVLTKYPEEANDFILANFIVYGIRDYIKKTGDYCSNTGEGLRFHPSVKQHYQNKKNDPDKDSFFSNVIQIKTPYFEENKSGFRLPKPIFKNCFERYLKGNEENFSLNLYLVKIMYNDVQLTQ